MHNKRSTFSGKLGFVLSAAGASVGLGNIWRFPYLAAKYGGGIFLLIYIVLALTFGYTMIIAETTLGRVQWELFILSQRQSLHHFPDGSMPLFPS